MSAPPSGNQPPTVSPTEAGQPPPPTEAPTLAPSELAADGPGPEVPVIPGYAVLGELGRGGMGVVYRARQEGLNRVVALKMVLAGAHAGADDLARFRAEAEAVARLQHPNIVQIYEVGEHHGLPYFSLEYCGGGSLAARLDGTPRPVREAAELVQVLGRAVHAAHEAGVVHRDLKPANVLLAACGLALPDAKPQAAIPKITDFGLAKRLDADAGQTRSGTILGTPSYMAPEQAAAKSREIGPHTDVYALGAILYELLTGRPPFRAETPLDTVLQVLADEPVPPSRLVPKLPRDLETITLKCLRKEPARRYASAAALADDLAAFLDGRPIAARPVGRAERAWRWCRRNQAVSAAAAAVALTLVAGSVVSTVFGLRADANARQARQAQEAAEQAQAEEANQRTAAQQAARQARQARDETARQLIGLLVSNGNYLLGQDDPAAALPWFAEAARRDPADLRHAGRLEGTLALLPRPVYFWRHDRAVTSLAVSPDGRRVVSGSEDGTARIWDLETGAAVGPPLRCESPVRAVAFSPDGKRVAAAGGILGIRGEVRVWDAAGGGAVGAPLRLPGLVLGVGFSDDGRRLTTAELTLSWNPLRVATEETRLTCRVHDAATGQTLGQAATNPVADPLATGPGPYVHAGTGRLLVIENRRVRVVDVATGKPLGGPAVHDQPIWFARLSADGGRAVSIDMGGAGKVLDVAGGPVRDLAVGHGWRPLDAALTGRGEVALAFYDGAVERYGLADGRPVPDSFRKVGAEGWSPHFDADGVLVTGLGPGGTARVWEVANGQPVSPVLRHGGTLACSAFAADGRRLVAGSDDGSVRAWDLAQAGEVPAAWIINQSFRHERVEFDAAGRCVVLGEGRLLRFDLAALRDGQLPGVPGDPSVRTTALSPDGTRLAVGTDRGEARLLDAATLRDVLPPLKHDRRLVLDALFSPDGRLLATRDTAGDNDVTRYLGEAHLWDAATGKPVTAAPLRAGPALMGGITCIAFSPDGRWLAAAAGRLTLGGIHSEVTLYEAATGKAVGRPLAVSAGKVAVRLAFGPDSRRLAALALIPSANSCELALWDVEAAKPVMPPVLLPGEPHALAFDPTGRRLAVAAGTVLHVWDPEAGKPVRLLPHPGEVTAVRYQQGGRVLLSVSRRALAHEVYLWDADTDEALRPPLRHAAVVESAAVSPDGRFLVTAGERNADRQVRVWDLVPDPGRAEERRRLARLLGGQEVDGTRAVPVPGERLAEDWEEVHRTNPGVLEPTAQQVTEWHDRQASWLITAQAWAAAARQFDVLAARQPENSWWPYAACACAMAAGDHDGLRRRAEALLRRNDKATNLYDIDRTVKSCLLLPGTLADPAPAVRLAERLGQANPADGMFPWYLLARGIARYRAGDAAGAAAHLERARAARSKTATCDALAGLFLAMARGKQGRAGEARTLLAEVERLVEALEKRPGESSWLDLVHCRAALREAKATVPLP